MLGWVGLGGGAAPPPRRPTGCLWQGRATGRGGHLLGPGGSGLKYTNLRCISKLPNEITLCLGDILFCYDLVQFILHMSFTGKKITEDLVFSC